MRYKILYINLFPEIGGAETSLIYLLQTLDKNRYDPYIILPKPGQFSHRLKNIARIIYFQLPGYAWQMLFIPGLSFIAAYRLFCLCKKIKPDLIHLNHITYAFYSGIIRYFLKIPVIATSWMSSDSIYFYQNIISNFGCNLILPVSPELKNRLLNKKFIPIHKIITLMPGIDTNFFAPVKNKKKFKKMLGINSSNITVSIVSRFDPIKDHMTFIKSMKLVIEKYPKVNILIAQDPNTNLEKNHVYPSIKSQIDNFIDKYKNLKKNIYFCGYKTDMRNIYAATDILVNTSLYESLGISLIEAAASGIPIVTTNQDSQHHVVINNRTGYLVKIKDHYNIAKKVIYLCQNRKLIHNFGHEARKHAISKFSINNYYKKIDEIYSKFIT